MKVDVAVVGAGPAGIAAAVSAARRGADTVLIDRSALLAGNAGNALVHTICGLFDPADEGEPTYANQGFTREFVEGLLRAGAAAPPERAGRVWVLPTYPHLLAAFASELCDSTQGLTFLLESEVAEAARDTEGFVLRTGASEVRARFAIDASGDASLANRLGLECAMSESRLQCPSYIFRVRGLDPRVCEGFARMRLSAAVARAEKDAQLAQGAGSILIRPAAVPGEAYVTLNIAKPTDRPYLPIATSEIDRLSSDARTLAAELVAFLRAGREGFARCEVVEWPRRIGVRETRRVVGRAVLDADDVLAGNQRDDEVARSAWPIELWNERTGASFRYPDSACSIPLGALIAKEEPRLGVAGRCMSATHEALGALRVIGTALATGAAIGTAAALACENGSSLADVRTSEVRDAQGA